MAIVILGGRSGGIDWLAAEFSRDRLIEDADLIGEPTREGIPISQWRALPDSPTAEPAKLQQ